MFFEYALKKAGKNILQQHHHDIPIGKVEGIF